MTFEETSAEGRSMVGDGICGPRLKGQVGLQLS